MKPLSIFVAFCFFAFSQASAQNNKNHLPGRPAEQKEIIADQHLEKEIQQKQLQAKPEMLEENKVNKVAGKKEGKDNCCRKNKSKKCKTGRS